MKKVPFVRDKEAELADLMTAKLLTLHRDSGIYFVSIKVEPPSFDTGKPVFDIFIGHLSDVNSAAMEPLVHLTLAKEIAFGTDIRVSTRVGTPRR